MQITFFTSEHNSGTIQALYKSIMSFMNCSDNIKLIPSNNSGILKQLYVCRQVHL